MLKSGTNKRGWFLRFSPDVEGCVNRLKRAETLEEKEQVFDEWQDDILASGGKDALAEFFADWTAYEWVNARRPPVESIPMN